MQEINKEIEIEKHIYEIRGKQVMLDRDLAKLYQCANGTKSINLTVKRHINRFPERFMFQLTLEETQEFYSRFQSKTLNKKNQKQGNNTKYLLYVFTEQGVAMLACESSNYIVLEQFPDIKKPIKGGNENVQYIIDYKLLDMLVI